jgi:hypothetical protein
LLALLLGAAAASVVSIAVFLVGATRPRERPARQQAARGDVAATSVAEPVTRHRFRLDGPGAGWPGW